MHVYKYLSTVPTFSYLRKRNDHNDALFKETMAEFTRTERSRAISMIEHGYIDKIIQSNVCFDCC